MPTPGDTTTGMMARLDKPCLTARTQLVILQPGGLTAAVPHRRHIAAIKDRLRARHIRIVVIDEKLGRITPRAASAIVRSSLPARVVAALR
jgi:hypothetical protein